MLYLTYKTGFNDGFGAQYQRMIGIYSLCKEFDLIYVHTPFENIEYQGITALEKNENDDNFVKRCNERTMYNSIDISKADIFVTIECIRITREDLLSLKKKSMDRNENVLLKLQLPYLITDRWVDIYSHCKGFYKPVIQKNKTFTIGMHVRRGELFVVDSQRMLPNSFYLNIVKILIRLLEELNVDYLIELYTEIPSGNINITPEHPGINKRIKKDVVIKPEYHKISDFDSLPKLNKYINEDVLDTFDRMVNCDILIASRSSLSACASYLKEGITIYHSFWHSMLKKDIDFKDPFLNNKVKTFINNVCK